VLQGKICHGVNGLAGEFGHVSLEPDGHPCGCGNRGCAEKYASASAILRMAREAIAAGNAPSLVQAVSAEPELVVKAIYELASQGDEPARRIFITFGRYLGILLVNLINVIDPETFVIGGGVASAWDAFAPRMFEELRTRSLISAIAELPTLPAEPSVSDHIGKTKITRALLGSDAGLYGAARATALAN
jgi:glucokinase